MIRSKTNGIALEKLHSEWLGNLYSYIEQLQNIDSITKQMQTTEPGLADLNGLKLLRNNIVLQRSVVKSLTDEVIEARQRFLTENEDSMVTIGVLMMNNNLREKIRKTEQSVFILKYQVNQLLSGAS